MNARLLAATYAAAFPNSRAWSPSEFETLLTDDATIIVGDEASFLIGRVVLDEAEILTFATRPDVQRQGLGRSVLLRFEVMARAKGVSRIHLEVAEDNKAARALYLASGYSQMGLRPSYYTKNDGSEVAALILSKRI